VTFAARVADLEALNVTTSEHRSSIHLNPHRIVGDAGQSIATHTVVTEQVV